MKTKGWMIAGLMAATAVALAAPAQAQEHGGQREGRGWQGRPGTDRDGNRAERGNWSRPSQQQSQGAAPQARTVPADRGSGARWGYQGRQTERPAVQQPAQPAAAPNVSQRQEWRNDRRDGRQDARDVRQDRREVRQDSRDVRQDRRDWRNDRQDWRNDRNDNRWNDNNRRYDNRWDGNRDRLDARARWSDQRRWDNGWRNDRRYDWQNYRSRYRNVYHMPRYYAPYGWNYGYRSFSIGIFLDSLLYSNGYWLDDPYRYRLPPAYGSLRWIRYYDDALLVDIRDGYVVDVIHNFFW